MNFTATSSWAADGFIVQPRLRAAQQSQGQPEASSSVEPEKALRSEVSTAESPEQAEPPAQTERPGQLEPAETVLANDQLWHAKPPSVGTSVARVKSIDLESDTARRGGSDSIAETNKARPARAPVIQDLPQPQSLVGSTPSRDTVIREQESSLTGSVDTLRWFARSLPSVVSSHPQSVPPDSLASESDVMQPAAPVDPNARLSEKPTQEMLVATVTTPNAISNEGEKQRHQLASFVSHQITTSEPAQPMRVVQPIDSPPGWHAIGERLGQHLNRCEMLLHRKAYFSAREEAELGMLYLIHTLDGWQNRYHCEPAWAAAQQALVESEDFASAQRLSSDEEFLQRLVASHETPVLKDARFEQLAPMTAAQHYRLYAQQCLAEAAQNHPWSSDIFYAIGRSYQAEADSNVSDAQPLRWRAITFYRAAITVDPANALAANQLGFILLQLDRARDAQAVLISSVNLNPSPAALQNLVEASYRIGDNVTCNWAATSLKSMQSPELPARGLQAPVQPSVTIVEPREFVAMSPYAAAAPLDNGTSSVGDGVSYPVPAAAVGTIRQASANRQSPR